MAKQAFHSSSSRVLILYWFVSTFCRALKRKYLLLSDLLFPDKKRQNSKEFLNEIDAISWEKNLFVEEFSLCGNHDIICELIFQSHRENKSLYQWCTCKVKKVLSEIVHIIFKTTPETQEMQNFYFTFTFYSAL